MSVHTLGHIWVIANLVRQAFTIDNRYGASSAPNSSGLAFTKAAATFWSELLLRKVRTSRYVTEENITEQMP
jgi:hypothetical protein